MDICSNCEQRSLESNSQGLVCLNCGHTTSNPDFQHEDVKYIEQNGRTKALMISVENQIQSQQVYIQTKRIMEIVDECDQDFNLADVKIQSKYEKKQILVITQDQLLRYKDGKIRLKSLISAVFFMVCLNSKKLIHLDVFLKKLQIKSKQFNKYLQDLKNRYQFPPLSLSQQLSEVLQIFTQSLHKFLSSPSPVFYLSMLSLAPQPFISHTTQLLYTHTLPLLSHPEINFQKTGKNPYLFITSLLIVVSEGLGWRLGNGWRDVVDQMGYQWQSVMKGRDRINKIFQTQDGGIKSLIKKLINETKEQTVKKIKIDETNGFEAADKNSTSEDIF